MLDFDYIENNNEIEIYSKYFKLESLKGDIEHQTKNNKNENDFNDENINLIDKLKYFCILFD